MLAKLLVRGEGEWMFIKQMSVVVFFGLLLDGSLLAQPSGAEDDKAISVYADAAEFHNNGAFELATQEWQKFIQQYPENKLASKAHHYLGLAYIQLQQYEKAAASLKTALADSKSDLREETMINLGWCQYVEASAEADRQQQQRGFSAARQSLTDFLRAYPKSDVLDQAYFYLGEIEYNGGNAKKAVEYYRKLLDNSALKNSPLRPDARYAAAVSYEEIKNVRRARADYQAFLKEHADHPLASEVSIRLADLMLADNDAGGAEQVLNGLAGNADMADYVLLRLAFAYSKQGKTKESTAKYNELLKRFPKSQYAPAAAVSVGQALYREGKYDEAIQQFRKATGSKDALAEDAIHWMAITLNRQNKFAEAQGMLEEALKWAKDSATLKMDFADALYNMPGQMKRASAAYEVIARSHSDDPLAPRAAYNAAFAALQLRDFAKAREWSKWFLSKFPQDPLRNDVAYVAAETLLQDGDYAAASQAYEQLLKVEPNNPSANLWTIRNAMSCYLDGKYSKSIQLINGSLNKFSQPRQKAEALFILGASLHYEERYAEAIRQFTASRAASSNWESADEVLLLLAEAQQRTNAVPAAKKALEDLLTSFPQSRLRPQAEYKLGQLAASTGDYAGAINRYKAIVGNPKAASYSNFAQYGVAWCLMQQEQFDAALKELEIVTGKLSGGALASEAALAKGVCLRKLNQVDKAIKTLEDFLATNPQGLSLGNGLYELGLAYTDTKKLKKANRLFAQLLEEVPDYPSKEKVLYELAWNFQDSDDQKSANRYFALIAKDYPNSEYTGEATYMMAQALYDQEKYAEAASGYRKSLGQTQAADLQEKSLYKLGWSLFQQAKFTEAASSFDQQTKKFPAGALVVDALFMNAECFFEQRKFTDALEGYKQARQQLEAKGQNNVTASQVRELIYLHGAQCLRETKSWSQCEQWLNVVLQRYPKSSYLPTALYELGFCKQQQKDMKEALRIYSNVAEGYRTEVGARSRFMMGEIHFGKREFDKAIPEFQRVMFGYGGEKAPDSIKNWQAKSAFEAARCSEILIDSLGGDARKKVIDTAREFYTFIVEKHSRHELVAQAKARLGDLQKLR
ncbi:MAG: tetratricopeptide repeat protein [Planctomycetota bacterium]